MASLKEYLEKSKSIFPELYEHFSTAQTYQNTDHQLCCEELEVFAELYCKQLESKNCATDKYDRLLRDGIFIFSDKGRDVNQSEVDSRIRLAGFMLCRLTAKVCGEPLDIEQINEKMDLKIHLDLIDFYKSSHLSSDQQRLISSLQNFFDDKSSGIYIIDGYAGTGKTFIMQGLCKYLSYKNLAHQLLAPTGRATMILSERTHETSETIYSHIYKQYESNEKRTYFKLRSNDRVTDCVYLIDEASMVSDQSDEENELVFGTGQLLTDLFTFIKQNKTGINKVVFVGDSGQLPPVKMDYSPALSQVYLENLSQWPVTIGKLKQVIRQKSENPILHNALDLRKSIESGNFGKIHFDFNGKELVSIEKSELLEKFMSVSGGLPSDQCILISATNKQNYEFNRDIRRLYFSGDLSLPVVGDRIVCVRTSFDSLKCVRNGTFGTVLSIVGVIERKTITPRGAEPVDLEFIDAVIQFDDDPQPVKRKILLSCLNNVSGEVLTAEQKQAREVMLSMVAREKYLESDGAREKKQKLDEVRQTDPYYNALLIKYGYGITCHKAQGGEWPHVFVDCVHLAAKKQSKEYFQWLYTAVTRSKNNLDLINAPSFNVDDEIKESTVSRTEFNKEVYLENLTGFVKKRLQEHGCVVEDIDEKQYEQVYRCRTEAGELVDLHISWNLKKVAHPVLKGMKTPTSEEVYNLFKDLKDTYIPDGSEVCKVKLDGYLQVFHEKLEQELSIIGVSILNLELLQWRLRYSLKRENANCIIDVNYSKSKITKHQFNKSSSQEFKNEIDTLFRKIIGEK